MNGFYMKWNTGLKWLILRFCYKCLNVCCNGYPTLERWFKNFSSLHDRGRYHIETSPLICSDYLLCKSMDSFLCDNGLRHERVKHFFDEFAMK